MITRASARLVSTIGSAVPSDDVYSNPRSCHCTESRDSMVGASCVTQRSVEDRIVAGTMFSARRMADGKLWTTTNLNRDTAGSYCYADEERNCGRYGRLSTWESAQRACLTLGDGWRLPTNEDWLQIAAHGTAWFYNFGQ